MIDNKVESIRKHVEAIAEILGLEKNESTENTPLRVAKMYTHELFKNRNNTNIEELDSRMTVFPSDNKNPVTVEVPFYSVCEHHWLPFMGTVRVTYIPNETIIGLSKVPRVVNFFSKKPQVQERLTQEIGEYLTNIVKPEYLLVRISAEHTCVSMRGAESECETTTTYEYGGAEYGA